MVSSLKNPTSAILLPRCNSRQRFAVQSHRVSHKTFIEKIRTFKPCHENSIDVDSGPPKVTYISYITLRWARWVDFKGAILNFRSWRLRPVFLSFLAAKGMCSWKCVFYILSDFCSCRARMSLKVLGTSYAFCLPLPGFSNSCAGCKGDNAEVEVQNL